MGHSICDLSATTLVIVWLRNPKPHYSVDLGLLHLLSKGGQLRHQISVHFGQFFTATGRLLQQSILLRQLNVENIGSFLVLIQLFHFVFQMLTMLTDHPFLGPTSLPLPTKRRKF